MKQRLKLIYIDRNGGKRDRQRIKRDTDLLKSYIFIGYYKWSVGYINR